MRHLTLFALLAAVLAIPASAQDPQPHLAQAEGIRILHAWTRATPQGEAYIFAQIENTSPRERRLIGAETAVATKAEVVGFAYVQGRPLWSELPGVPVAAGGALHLEPDALALRLSGLSAPLKEGDPLALIFLFDGLEIAAKAEIRDPSARQHSHAGHSH